MMNIKLFVSLRGSSLTHRLWAWCSSKNAVFLSSSMALHTSLMISSRWAFFYSFMGISQRKYAQFIWIFKIVQICFIWISKTVLIYVFLWIPKMVIICFFLNFQNSTKMFFFWISKIVQMFIKRIFKRHELESTGCSQEEWMESHTTSGGFSTFWLRLQ